MTDTEWLAAVAVFQEMDRRMGTTYAFVSGMDSSYAEWLSALRPLFQEELDRRGEPK